MARWRFPGRSRTAPAILAAFSSDEADLAYIGTPFIATTRSRAGDGYKRAIVEGNSADIVGTSLFTGVFGNYLKPSIVSSGYNPEDLPTANSKNMDFQRANAGGAKPWKDIWGSGQGIDAIREVTSAERLVARLREEYARARERLQV